MELDPKYVDVVTQRWQTLSGKQAMLDGDGHTFDQIAEERQQWRYESLVAAWRLRPSKPCSVPGIPICKGCAWHWRTGLRNFGSCRVRNEWPQLRHTWPTFVARPAGVCANLVTEAGNRQPEAEKPAAGSAGRPKGGGMRLMLLIDPVSALPSLGLEALDGVTCLFHRAGHEPTDRVALPMHRIHMLACYLRRLVDAGPRKKPCDSFGMLAVLCLNRFRKRGCITQVAKKLGDFFDTFAGSLTQPELQEVISAAQFIEQRIGLLAPGLQLQRSVAQCLGAMKRIQSLAVGTSRSLNPKP
jgi:hypothetical protein